MLRDNALGLLEFLLGGDPDGVPALLLDDVLDLLVQLLGCVALIRQWAMYELT